MFRRATADPALPEGLDFPFDSRAGADDHDTPRLDISLVRPDDRRPLRESVPEPGFAVFDHVEPVEEDAVTSSSTVGFSGENTDIGGQRVRVDVSRVDPGRFSADFVESNISPDRDVLRPDRPVSALVGQPDMIDLLRIEMEDTGADNIVGHGIRGHDYDSEMPSVLGQLVSPARDFDGVGGDEIRPADLEEIDDFFIQFVVVVPHPLSITEDAHIEFDGGRNSLNENIGLELGRENEEITIGDFPARPDTQVDSSSI